MKQYEYHLLDTSSGLFSGIDLAEMTSHLNSLGQLGWEIVAVNDTIFTRSHSRGLLITLKREVGSERPAADSQA